MPDIFLLPGEYYFGKHPKKIKTLLGSCVAITMWNKDLKAGGMCHYKLPQPVVNEKTVLDGSYGEAAMLLFMKSLYEYNLECKDMEVGVFGAGEMFLNIAASDDSIGKQNFRLAYRMLQAFGFRITHESLGGNVSRRIELDLESGLVKVQSLSVDQQKWL